MRAMDAKSDGRPSIALSPTPWKALEHWSRRDIAQVRLRNAAPVLLEIAAAALARADAECTCGQELGCFTDCATVVTKDRELAALRKVRP